MRIALDVRMIQHTGIGTYIRGLLGGFMKEKLPEGWDLHLLGDPEDEFVQQYPWPCIQFKAPIYTVQEQFAYASLLPKFHLWHSPHYNSPLLVPRRTRLVVTVHDLIHWIYRHDFFTPLKGWYARLMFTRIVNKADRMIAVSRRTRDDLIHFFWSDPIHITVISEAVDGFSPETNEEEGKKIKKRLNLPDKYFFYIGSLKPHKNVQTLIQVFRRLRQTGKTQAELVIVGRKDRKYNPDFQELAKLETGGGIIYIPETDPGTVLDMYRHALALVHPSFYEGFGLTLLEAMACGTPVISSAAASMPEVAGDAAILVNPASPIQIAEAMIKVENDAQLRQDMRQKGLARVKQFDWQQTAHQTLKVYQEVLGS